MFEGWDNFYLLIGSSAGALIGVMFVVATLVASLGSPSRNAWGSQVYISPIVFHFGIVVLFSALTAVPGIPAALAIDGVAIVAVAGFAYSAATTLRLFRPGVGYDPDWEDRIYYGFLT